MSDEKRAAAAAERLAEACTAALRTPTRAVVLYGSLTMGDFRPGTSDIDLLLVVDEPLRRDEIDALTGLVAAADTATASGVDLHVVTSGVAAAPTRTPSMELHVGRYPGIDLEVEPKVAAVADLPAELSMARLGRALAGPVPTEIIAVPDPAWLRERSLHWLTTWLTLTDDTEHAAFMVLTACRMWRFCLEGVHSTKTEAGRWALARDGSLSAVSQALRQRMVDPAVAVDEDGIRTVLETVIREIRPVREDGVF